MAKHSCGERTRLRVGVEQQGLHETVTGAFCDTLQIRLRYAPCGICARVYQDCLREAVHEQRGGAAEYIEKDVFPGIRKACLDISELGVQVVGNIFHFAVLHVQGILQIGKNLLQDIRLAEAVHAQKERIGLSQLQRPAHQIEAAPQRKVVPQVFDIVVQVGGQVHTKHSLSEFYLQFLSDSECRFIMVLIFPGEVFLCRDSAKIRIKDYVVRNR